MGIDRDQSRSEDPYPTLKDSYLFQRRSVRASDTRYNTAAIG